MRLLHKASVERYDDAEREAMAAVLARIGVVLSIERHPRGGYAVQLDHQGEIDELVRFIDGAGYMSVV